ncbi:PorT family protein [Capnocytophaga catalasegens]|uniref:Outer membrane protein beta-barrel domain-containing protein n=1 Tax=Capnocytophaga catalasegens TaxID=1004260 RepID=A0AAV5AV13_9FLAO|nr:PorT family protein [Capnocytophaga catalasegens]GIZ15728.1 hypothetical protein RCZ03_17280 [Capnocytophaga catalasegens]GJM50115.1 hypothetical protein RCZ15_10890 [Capnocytophaga catalasegens]GJM53060.1 hypothetical protein RCZ16_13770 [Capnocytophaga catalasegens]
MKEEWLKDIHKQMTDYELDEPDNLWEQIQTKMSEEKNKRNRTIALLWTKRLASAVAIVFLLFSIGQYLGKNTDSATIKMVDVPKKIVSKQEDNVNNNLSSPSIVKNKNIFIEKNTTQNTSEKIVSAEKKSLENTKQKPQNKSNFDTSKVVLIQKNMQMATIKTDYTLTENLENEPQSRTSEEILPEEMAQVTTDKAPKRMAFGVFTSGGASSSLNSESVNQDVFPSIGSDESTWKDSPLLGALATQGREIETKTKHQLPIRAGLLFSYEISNRLGIESGVTYTFLASDIREGDDNLYFTSRQQLHYVGIPLKVRYKILDTRGFELYSSLGVLSEKNISGTSKKTYFFDNQVTQTENEKVKINPWQWSANTSVGVQYNFTPLWGIYAEPGVSYFFKNNSPVETIYTDKPFNFNFSLGLRFTLGR